MSKIIKFYANPIFRQPEHQSDLNDLMKAHWSELLSAEQLVQFGARINAFEQSLVRELADVVLFPYTWNYCLNNNQVDLCLKELEFSRQVGKPFIIFSEGDFTARVPFSGAMIFEPSSYRSRRHEGGNQRFAFPSFISDFVKYYCNGTQPLREKSSRPVVGFCGQAGGTWFDFLRRRIVNSYRWFLFYLGLRKWEPAPFETTRFRKSVLGRLSTSPYIETNFVIRNKYRAGYWKPKVKDPFHPTRVEYVQNLKESDYIVCLRGGGNFSVRFYETLSMGRIPIFVDTDCLLPFDHILDYRRYCIWIDRSDIPYIAEKVADFHAALSSLDFRDLQVECRRLWLDYLSADGFYQNFHLNFNQGGC